MADGARNILNLPVDVLRRILYHALFAGASLETCCVDTGVRKRILFKLTPYTSSQSNTCLLATKPSSLFSVCSLFHSEGIDVLYKAIFLDLCYSGNHERAATFLSTVGLRNAALIRCMRLTLGVLDASLPSCVFANMTNIVARDFTNLEKLIVVYPVQEEELQFYAAKELDEGEGMAKRLEAVLQTLSGLNGTRLEIEGPARVQALSQEDASVALASHTTRGNLNERKEGMSLSGEIFAPWKRLPRAIKRAIIRHAVLPPNGLVHPLLRVSTFAETQMLMSLLLTSKELSEIAEDVVYTDAVFMSCLRKDRGEMYDFFRRRTERQLRMIKRYNTNGLDHWHDRRFLKFLSRNCPDAIDMEPLVRQTMGIHPCWDIAEVS